MESVGMHKYCQMADRCGLLLETASFKTAASMTVQDPLILMKVFANPKVKELQIS